MRNDLPFGTVTFLFTDVEGSTRLLHELGEEAYAAALAEHRRVIRAACVAEGGVEVDTQGDAFFFAFASAPRALAAAGALTGALASGPIRVRVGLHTGVALLTDEGYVGDDVHVAARVAASAHGGQVVCSAATVAALGDSDSLLRALSDLGEHRLKDIAGAVSIYQLGITSFPPLKTISNTNLPRPASSFLGREAELGEVLSRIEQGARLVTLTGPGGTGKTRLALEAAASLVGEYKAGVFWVGLASLRDPALVTETIARVLGAKDSLVSHIGERQLLLLLDNLEQVIEAAPELGSLLSACPNLNLLVTSRELLRVSGEVEYPVPPLATTEAVALFCERAQLESSEEIAELCTRLDSLPLAVELAAARTKALTPAQILGRLSQRLDVLKGGRDADPRQQTLRATMDWSYELLSLEEQELFASLSVFAGGCALAAAEEVAGADIDTLESLVDKSLLRFTPSELGGRYWMLETIREYAAERLERSGDTRELRRRHAEWFLALADAVEPRVRADWEHGLDRLESERDNLWVSLDWFEESGADQAVLQMGGALWRFWNIRGYSRKARLRLERVLDSAGDQTNARARALIAVAAMATRSGDHAAGMNRASEAFALCRSLGDTWGAALAQSYVATAAAEQGSWSTAKPLIEDSRSAFLELGDEYDAMLATWLLACVCREMGDNERSVALLEENVHRARELDNRRVEAMSLAALAMHAVDEGRIPEAVPMLEAAYRIDCEVGEPDRIALDLCRFAYALISTGDVAASVRVLAKGESLLHEIGATPSSIFAVEARVESTSAAVRHRLDDRALAQSWEEGERLTADEAVALALSSLS